MDLEEDEFCNVCGLVGHMTDLCPLLHSSIRVLDASLPSKAILTLPKNIEAKNLVPGKYDITAKTRIPKGCQFGPVKAPKFSEFNPKCSYMLKLFQGKHEFYYLDTSDENKCNWMTLVPFSDNPEARNCICYQLCDDIFFTVVVDVEPGESLVVGYSPGYLSRLQEDEKLQSSLIESFSRDEQQDPSKACDSCSESTFDGKSLIANILPADCENADQNDCNGASETDSKLDSVSPRRSGRKRKAVEFKNFVFSLVDAASPHNEQSTGFTEVINSASNFEVISSSILAEEESDSSVLKFDEVSRISVDRGSTTDDGTSDFDGEDEKSLPNDSNNKPSRGHYPKRKSARLGAVLAVDEWKCKFCHKIEGTVSEFASHLIEHYKTVGAARTEKSRLTRLSDQTSSEDTSEENFIKEEPTEVMVKSAVKVTEPRFPYYCDICAVKKLFNRGEYIIRHLRIHMGELTCPICNQVFNKGQYSTHECIQDEDSSGSILKCTVCDKLYRSEKKLQLHIETVHSKGAKGTSTGSKCQKSFCKVESYARKCRKTKSSPLSSKERNEEDILVLHKCELCESSFSKAKDLEKHLKSHGESFSCSLCGKYLTNRTFKMHHSLCQAVAGFLSRDLKMLKCPKCSLVFDDMDCFRSHVANHTHVAMCPECNLRLPSTTDIKSHSCVRFQCDGCREEFETLIHLKKHIIGRHGQAEYYCFECAFPFVTRDGFNDHRGCGPEKTEPKKKTSQDEGFFVCEVCGATYTKWSSLKTHRYTHGPKRFACSICGKSFHRREMLADHEFVHQEAQFQCAECGKKLKSRKSLDVHMQIHKGNKRFQCDKCSKAFCQKINLQTHILSHLPSEEKGFECSYCQKKFASKEYLGFHIEGHVKGKNEICDICGRSFVKSHMLNQHRRTAHGNQKYTCEFCNLTVRQKHSLTRHLVNRHQEFKDKWNVPGYMDSRYMPGDGTYETLSKRQRTGNDNCDSFTVSDDDMESVIKNVNLQVETEEIAFTHDDIVIPENMMILQVEEGGEIVLTLAGPDSAIPNGTVVESMIVEEALEL